MLKSKLKNCELSIGSWIMLSDIKIPEILALANFEWLCIDMEHTSLSYSDTEKLIIATQGQGLDALVRVSSNAEEPIKKVLDMGANGVIVPMVNSAEDAKKAVSFVHYPPLIGKRGVGLYRAQKFGHSFELYKEKLLSEISLIVQIEHIDAINELDGILSVEQIDGIIVGPYDLSASLGKPGDFSSEKFLNALSIIKTKCMLHKKPYGFHVVTSNVSSVIEKIQEGASFIAYGVDAFFLKDAAINGMNILKEKLMR